jgi:hypothetical protein
MVRRPRLDSNQRRVLSDLRGDLVGEAGFENGETARIDQASPGYVGAETLKGDDGARKGPDAEGFGPTFGPTESDSNMTLAVAADPNANMVENALAKALEAATAAGRFDVVAQLVRELEARRFARVRVRNVRTDVS